MWRNQDPEGTGSTQIANKRQSQDCSYVPCSLDQGSHQISVTANSQRCTCCPNETASWVTQRAHATDRWFQTV